MNRYCIAKMRGKILSFLLDEGGHALEIHADGEKECAAVGNIYIGRVQSVSKNIRAAFVEVEHGVICYLPLDDLKDPCYTRKGPVRPSNREMNWWCRFPERQLRQRHPR